MRLIIGMPPKRTPKPRRDRRENDTQTDEDRRGHMNQSRRDHTSEGSFSYRFGGQSRQQRENSVDNNEYSTRRSGKGGSLGGDDPDHWGGRWGVRDHQQQWQFRGRDGGGLPPPPGFDDNVAPASGTVRSRDDRIREEEVRKDRKSIPSLEVKPDQDARTIVHLFQTWLTMTSLAISTWNQKAPEMWEEHVRWAQERHEEWLSLTPAEKARERGTGRDIGLWNLPRRVGIVEGLMRSELLDALPRHYKTACVLENALDVRAILLIVMKLALPSAEQCRLQGLDAVEAPLKPARNYTQALNSLRRWHHSLQVAIIQLRAQPDAMRLMQALSPLCSDLVRGDASFQVEYAQLLRDAHVRVSCTPPNVMAFVALLESELSQRCHEEVGARSRPTGRTNDPAVAQAMSTSNKKPSCPNFVSDQGCTAGGKCPLYHPPAFANRCFNCGSKEHRIAECTRPKRESKKGIDKKGESKKGDSKGKMQKGSKNKVADREKGVKKGGTQQSGRGGSHGKGGRVGQANPNLNEISGGVGEPNVIRVEELQRCEVSKKDLCNAVGGRPCYMDFLQRGCLDRSVSQEVALRTPEGKCDTEDSQAKSLGVSEEVCHNEAAPCVCFEHVSPDVRTHALLDSGATHLLMSRELASEEDLVGAREIEVDLASGKRGRVWVNKYSELIGEKGIRCLYPVGRYKMITGLFVDWEDEEPYLCLREAGDVHVVLKGLSQNNLPLITLNQFRCLRDHLRIIMQRRRKYTVSEWADALRGVDGKDDTELNGLFGGGARNLSRDLTDVWGMDSAPCVCGEEVDEERVFEEETGLGTGAADVRASGGSEVRASRSVWESLERHQSGGHVNKHPRCPACIKADGPRKVHRRIEMSEKAPYTLHVDLGGPMGKSIDGKVYILVGALRMPDIPLMVWGIPLTTKGAAEVMQNVMDMISWFESLHLPSLASSAERRIKRVQSDRGLEFCNDCLHQALTDKLIHHSTTVGYDPASNGTAEMTVGRIKTVARRLLSHSGLGYKFWSFAVRYASVSLMHQALGICDHAPPFGSWVIVKKLARNHGDEKTWGPRGETGRLLWWDVLRDGSTWILDPTEGSIWRAGKPVPIPQPPVGEILPLQSEELEKTVWRQTSLPDGMVVWVHIPTLKISFGPPSKVDVPESSDSESKERIDVAPPAAGLEPWDEVPPAACPSIIKSGQKQTDIISGAEISGQTLADGDLICCSRLSGVELNELPTQVSSQQAKGHIAVATRQVLNSKGDTRRRWIDAARREVDSLKREALVSLTDEEMANLSKIQRTSEILLAHDIWSIKSSGRHKCRVVGLGNLVGQFGPTSVSDLDSTLFRVILAWGVTVRATLSAVDISTAFLNAPLPSDRKILLTFPKSLKTLGVISDDRPMWVTRALYGLKESPKLWADFRDSELQRLRFRADGQKWRLLQSEVSRSVWLVVREDEITHWEEKDEIGETSAHSLLRRRLQEGCVVAVLGIYVDDILVAAQTASISQALISKIGMLWTTSDPETLGQDGIIELNFLGVRVIADGEGGLLLHQLPFAHALLGKTSDTRVRDTPGEPQHFKKGLGCQDVTKETAHPTALKEQQATLGSLLWLAVKTRPDLSWAHSVAASALHRDLEECKTRTQWMVRYLRSYPHLGLHFQSPSKPALRLDVWSDASFAPEGRESRSGVLQQVCGMPVAWASSKQPIVTLSSAECELVAVTMATNSMRAIRTFCEELWAVRNPSVTLWVDNSSALVHLNQGVEAPWRSKHISMRASHVAQMIKEGQVQAQYISTKSQLADLFTKGLPVRAHKMLCSQLPLSEAMPLTQQTV